MGHAEPDADSNADPDTQQFAEQGTAAVTGSTAVQRANRAGAADSFRGSTRGLREGGLQEDLRQDLRRGLRQGLCAGLRQGLRAPTFAYAKACGRKTQS